MNTLEKLPVRDYLPSDRKPELVMLSGLNEKTAKSYLSDLRIVASHSRYKTVEQFPWESLRYQDVQAIVGYFLNRAVKENGEPYQPSTISRMLSALKNVCKETWKLGLMNQDEWLKVQDVKAPEYERPLAGRVLNIGEIDKLLKVCRSDPKPRGIRDGCIIALMYLCGLRRFEITGMLFKDLDGDTILARGKRDRHENVLLLNGAVDWLNAWLSLRGDSPGPMFYRVKSKAGDLGESSMSNKSVERLVQLRSKQASVKDVHSHDFRRSLCTHLLEMGIDIFTVAKISRHKNLDVLRRYDRRTDEEKRKALRKIHVVSP